LSKTAKFVYLIVAVLAMAGLAVASLAMAENRAVLSVAMFVLSFAVIAVSFIMKAKIRARSTKPTPHHKREA
jgi:hypothetical protein